MKTVKCGAVLALLLLSGCRSFQARWLDLLDCGRVSVGVGAGVHAHAKLGILTAAAVGTRTATGRVGLEDRAIIGTWRSREMPFPTMYFAPPVEEPTLAPALNALQPRRPTRSELEGLESSLPTRRDMDRAKALAPLPMPLVTKEMLVSGMHEFESLAMSYKRKDRMQVNLTGPGVVQVTIRRRYGFWHPFHDSPPDQQAYAFNRTLDIEAGLTLGVVGARVGINPLEILDFVFGFLRWDMASDDP